MLSSIGAIRRFRMEPAVPVDESYVTAAFSTLPSTQSFHTVRTRAAVSTGQHQVSA